MSYFGDYLGLDNINFEVDFRQSIVFWGSKFSGKTNLLKAIAGIEKVNGGSVEFCGKDINTIKTKERNFAFTFDQKSLFQKKSVGYNIVYPLILRNFDKNIIERRLQLVASSFGLIECLKSRVCDIDEKKKCLTVFARFFIRECDLYLADCVFENLNQDERLELFKLFNAYVKNNDLPVVFCTDNFEEALSFSGKIGILNNCKLVDFGVQKELQKNMKHLQVQKCFSGEDVEIGILLKVENKYFIEYNDCKVETAPPVDEVYLHKEVIFLIDKNFVKYYYDLASEFRISIIST